MGKRKKKKFNILKLLMLGFLAFLIVNFINDRLDNSASSNDFFNEKSSSFSLSSIFKSKDYKTDDMAKLRANIEKEANNGNEKARWIYDNFDQLDDVLLYLSGNDADTIDFVYNYSNGITAFDFYQGQSVNFDRNTPYFIQWDNRWAYNPLGHSNIGIAGCGPTSMAMALARLSGDISISPDKIADDAQGYMSGDGISWSFFADEAHKYGYSVSDIENNKDAMIEALNYGPLIVSVDRGYFTLFGHILVIDSYQNGKFIINDPNSIKKSQQKWSYRQINDQIVHIWLVS
ncbi:C39 family peptidase [uncultured Anaerococcus sp.]|uniref:C39 family peptidase n=1 Tax=uncultured Anaerococcus sp. TaxID=293428 RepID=UPI00262F6BD1|nr:C39 family peptidase [uncultured Anaerococcus sp.]